MNGVTPGWPPLSTMSLACAMVGGGRGGLLSPHPAMSNANHDAAIQINALVVNFLVAMSFLNSSLGSGFIREAVWQAEALRLETLLSCFKNHQTSTISPIWAMLLWKRNLGDEGCQPCLKRGVDSTRIHRLVSQNKTRTSS
jgi:hypothetical protein